MVFPLAPTQGTAVERNPAPAESVRQAAPRDPRSTATENKPSAAELADQLAGLRAEHSLPDGRKIEFSFDDKIDRVIVTVKSAESGEIVRQIPPEQYQQFLLRFNEMLGVLFDETA